MCFVAFKSSNPRKINRYVKGKISLHHALARVIPISGGVANLIAIYIRGCIFLYYSFLLSSGVYIIATQ